MTGRGPLPAIRVGNQPYGVLRHERPVALEVSDARQVAPVRGGDPLDEMTPYLAQAACAARAARKTRWQAHGADVCARGRPRTRLGQRADGRARPASDVRGVLPAHRLSPAVPRRLQELRRPRAVATQTSSPRCSGHAGDRTDSISQCLASTPRLRTSARRTALNVLWQHYIGVARRAEPGRDSKPPSETSALTHNYIDWLLNAETTDKIVEESFPGKAPSSLLYLMLRNALLLQLHAGSYEWLKDRGDFTPRARAIARTPVLMPGVQRRASRALEVRADGVKVDAVTPAHPAPGTSVADWIWTGPLAAEVEAAFAQEQRAALKRWCGQPPRSCERCLVEHLDCCQYRLDAWETGLFAQRLYEQRRTGLSQDRAHGRLPRRVRLGRAPASPRRACAFVPKSLPKRAAAGATRCRRRCSRRTTLPLARAAAQRASSAHAAAASRMRRRSTTRRRPRCCAMPI